MVFFVPVEAATYATRTPYLSITEYQNAPTGVAWNDLMPKATGQAQRDAALKQCIARASSWADEICHQILAATIQWKQDRSLVRPNDDGMTAYFDAVLDQTPLIGVSQVLVGSSPTSMTALTDLTGLEPIGRQVLRVPTSAIVVGTRALWQIQYIAGFANASLTSAVSAGATSLPVSSTLGFAPGQTITLAGSGGVEYPTVAGTYVPSASTAPGSLPLAAATAGAYAVNDSASAMPPSLKEAVINLTTLAIKTRGQYAIVMRHIRDQADTVDELDSASLNLYATAEALLENHKRVV